MKTIIKSIASILIISIAGSFYSLYGQSSTNGNARNNAAWFLGWNGTGSVTTGSLEIQNQFGGEEINFSTNDGTGTTQKATIQDNGFVGIGTASPVHLLDVNGGDINVNTAGQGYRINGEYVLVYPVAGSSSIFVGVNAGTSSISGGANTFVGAFSGESATTSGANTYIGNSAGFMNEGGSENVAVGVLSAGEGASGDENVSVGVFAGYAIDGGDRNANIGHSAGADNITGNNNVFVGANANPTASNLSNSTAIGANSSVSQSNSLILGSISSNPGSPPNTNVGIGTTAPSTRLHIVTTDGAGTGFRLVDGTQAANRVLTSDANGNASWQAPPTAAVSTCATPVQNRLIKWCNNGTSVFGNSIVYDDGTRVGISTNAPSVATKLHIENNASSWIGSYTSTTTGSGTSAIGVVGASRGASLSNIGVIGEASHPITFFSVLNLLGLFGNTHNVGVVGRAQRASVNFGGIFEAGDCPSAARNYGIYARANRGCNTLPPPNYAAGYFDGYIWCTEASNLLSDQKFKDSISTITNAIALIQKIQPRSYTYKQDSFPSINLPIGRQFGVLAQNLDTVLPMLVAEGVHPEKFDTSGALVYDSIAYKGVNYTGLIPITIAAIQEQQQMIDSLAATQVSAQTNPTDTNRIVKWSGVNHVLANSLLYDNGTAVGLPGTKPGSFFNVSNTTDTVALSVSSTHSSTTAVVDITYSGGTAADHAVAVRGTSVHTISGGGTGGWGARFEGGQLGVAGIGIGNNSTVAGVYGSASGASFLNAGVLGNAEAVADTINAGIYGASANAEMMNAGIVGGATESSASAINYGSYNIAARSQHENMAGYFNAEDTIGLNYGVYAEVYAMDSDAWAGYFKGNVHYTGRLTAGSDAKLKANIQVLQTDSALALLAKLQPKTYTYNSSAVQNLGMPTGKQYGLIAQEVQQVLPELVSHITQPETRNLKGQVIHQQEHYLGLNYQGLIPVLIGAVNEQQRKIDSLNNLLNSKLAAIENRLNSCCGLGGASHKTDEGNQAQNNVSVELSNVQVIVLDQNVPNPFAEQTSISYHIPTGMGDGQMVFTDMLGNIIKTAEVKNGYGTVTVFAGNLSSGQYSYTLIVNGKTIETKKMVKQR